MILLYHPYTKFILSTKITSSILKRFMGKETGYARKILAGITNSSISPKALPHPHSTFHSQPLKPVEQDPSTMGIPGFPLHNINPSLVDKGSTTIKIKDTILKIIPSTRPYNIHDLPLQPKDSMTIQGKEALAMFLQYFDKLPDEYIKNPEYLIMYHKILSEKHPEVFVRAYQLALEIYYNKRQYSEQEICNIFENKFSIKDFVGFNNGITDTSTFFSGLQTNHLYAQPGFAQKWIHVLLLHQLLIHPNLKIYPRNY